MVALMNPENIFLNNEITIYIVVISRVVKLKHITQ